VNHCLRSALLASLLTLSACTSWPPPGRGGFAEVGPDTFLPVEADHPLDATHGLRFDFLLARLHLKDLVVNGARNCFPASVEINTRRENRIARQLAGGLLRDAQNDIIEQRQALALLQRQLDDLRDSGACKPSVGQGAVDRLASDGAPSAQRDSSDDLPVLHEQALERIRDLLNSDNQFAFASSEVNPKYAGRLVEAAALMRELGDYHLEITGHTDELGSAATNHSLAEARARSVQQVLLQQGVPPYRLSMRVAGASQPLFAGQQSHYRLVNRRVSIQLNHSSVAAQAVETR
jgi:outer membrane protein OmpA-like peptidoglycan-associated protein